MESILYVSCRDRASIGTRKRYSFREAVFAGWAEDGGMLMPERIPRIPASTLRAWRQRAAGFTYNECCFEVLRRFIPREEIPDQVLLRIIIDAFSSFGHSDVVCKRSIGSCAVVLELFHGPTLAFKDLGMQVLCRILEFYLNESKERLNLLVGTSGDTGSSAIEAVKNIPCVTITVLYPGCNRITRLQELQMTMEGEFAENGVKVIAVDGTSDDLDVPIEMVFGDVAFRKMHRIGSVNSVNICRVLVQVVHFIWSTVTSEKSDGVRFFVPTGAGGHVTAGVISRIMLMEDETLPNHIELHVATNANNTFHRILSTGTVTKEETKSVSKTVAPSMDISVPYNLERLMWIAAMEGTDIVSGEDENDEKEKRCIAAADLLRSFKMTGGIVLPEDTHTRILRVCGISGSSYHSNESILTTIKAVNDADGYVLDPHTAVGVAAMMSHRHQDSNICMACAHPAKFSTAIHDALGMEDGQDPWWWLSSRDRAHPSVLNLLELDKTSRVPAAEFYELGTDWTSRLRQWFEAQTGEQMRVSSATSKS